METLKENQGTLTFEYLFFFFFFHSAFSAVVNSYSTGESDLHQRGTSECHRGCMRPHICLIEKLVGLLLGHPGSKCTQAVLYVACHSSGIDKGASPCSCLTLIST